MNLSARLDAKQEIPRPEGVPATARGSFAASLAGRTLSWRLTFSGLTGKATAAHIHLAKAGLAGPVAVALCGPCRSGARERVQVRAKVVPVLRGGGAYVNVHTAKNPAGEIRGQVRVVKPASAPPAPPATTSTTSTDTGQYEEPGY